MLTVRLGKVIKHYSRVIISWVTSASGKESTLSSMLPPEVVIATMSALIKPTDEETSKSQRGNVAHSKKRKKILSE